MNKCRCILQSGQNKGRLCGSKLKQKAKTCGKHNRTCITASPKPVSVKKRSSLRPRSSPPQREQEAVKKCKCILQNGQNKGRLCGTKLKQKAKTCGKHNRTCITASPKPASAIRRSPSPRPLTVAKRRSSSPRFASEEKIRSFSPQFSHKFVSEEKRRSSSPRSSSPLKEQKINDGMEYVVNTKLIQGYHSNSASPSDIWLVEDLKDHKRLIAKIFIRNTKVPVNISGSAKRIFNIINIDGELLHNEAIIYNKVKRELIIERRMIFYVNIRYHEQNLTALDLWKWALTLKATRYFEETALLRNLVNNIEYMLDRPDSRESITHNLNEKAKPEENNLNIEKIKEWTDNGMKFEAIVTGMIGGGSLFKWIRENPSRLLSPVIPALFFSIYCLSEEGINQNDLHWSNVLVETKGPKEPRYVLFMDTIFLLDVGVHPVLYDFDRGVMQGKGQPLLKGFSHAGNCEFFHKNRDITKSMCVLYHECDRVIQNKLLPEEDLKDLKKLQKLVIDCMNSQELIIALKEYKNKDCKFKQPGHQSLLCSKKSLDGVKTEEFIYLLFKTTCPSIKANLFLNDPVKNVFVDIVRAQCKGSIQNECFKQFMYYTSRGKKWVEKFFDSIRR